MAKKRKSGNQQFKVVVGIVIIVCALLVAYGPLKEAWQQYGNDTFKEWASDITRSTAAQEKPATAQPSAETAQAPATKSDKSATTPSKPTTQSKPATAQNKAGTTPAPQPTAKAGSTPQKQKITVNPLLPAPLKDRPEKILRRSAYTTSYNRTLKVPNWVAWELTTEKLVERESRSDKFRPDPDLPASEAVTTDDYKRSGYDRGHMCPAGDNRYHWRAMQESFYMTNICPQDHNLNRGDWKELEEDCRRWVERDKRLYIVCGPIYYKGKPYTIGREHKIAVPDAFFKVILCTESNPPRAIGFIYKNTSGNRKLDAYVNSVDEVERITGINFFPALPDDIERQVEASYNLKAWDK